MFYNVENLFDCYDDPEKNDDEFLPDRDKYWTDYRYKQKLRKTYQVISALGEWNKPTIIGLCEIENKKVLTDLINKTPLNGIGYEIIHFESPDKRGIDVGLLYQSKDFVPIVSKQIPVHNPESNRSTRDILYVSGVLNNIDTLHIFINHWPSRWGGQLETEHKRMFAASVLKKHTDSLFEISENPKIIIAGDLNDYPDDKSLINTLNAKTSDYKSAESEELYNLAYYMQFKKKQGSHKYRGEWGVLDQLIVSGSLLKPENNIYTTIESANVFNAEFLLETDTYNTGKTPFRTYKGYKYNSGFSDHLPVYLDLFINQE